MSRIDALYGLVANEDDARVCRDISDQACRVVPRNFFLLVAAQVLTKLGDNLASAKTVLAWLMAFVGAPAYLVGLLVPLRESGSMLPQIFIGDVVRRRPRRKPVARLSILRTDPAFRRFVITRALLMCTALSAPYYILLARRQAGADLSVLGAFVVANGLAITLSAPIWGVFADASSRRVLIAAAAIASVLGVVLFLLVEMKTGVMQSGWSHPVAFFILGVSHSGVRAGRKT